MPLDPLHGLHPSPEARCLFALLHRRGGSMRIGPLLRALGLDQRIVATAVTELGERYGVTVICRDADPSPAADTGPRTEIYRLCTTRFGRRKYRSTWPID